MSSRHHTHKGTGPSTSEYYRTTQRGHEPPCSLSRPPIQMLENPRHSPSQLKTLLLSTNDTANRPSFSVGPYICPLCMPSLGLHVPFAGRLCMVQQLPMGHQDLPCLALLFLHRWRPVVLGTSPLPDHYPLYPDHPHPANIAPLPSFSTTQYSMPILSDLQQSQHWAGLSASREANYENAAVPRNKARAGGFIVVLMDLICGPKKQIWVILNCAFAQAGMCV